MNKPSSAQDDPSALTRPWALAVDEAVDRLDVDAETGLSKQEASARFKRYGPNRLREVRGRPAWRILLDQFKTIVVLILAVAGALAFAFGELPEGVAILAVITINGLIAFVSEWRATRSMQALRETAQPAARVRRQGEDREAPVEDLVPGDVVLLEAGDVVPADVRLVEANNLRVDESAMTGESEPVGKLTEAIDADTPLADRSDMLFKGTTLTEGSARGVVAATGMETEIGRISELAQGVEDERTPLERRLEKLGARLAWITLALAATIAAAGVWAGQTTLLIIETSIALGVAAVPEALPIVANLSLARGMWLMAESRALINRLPAVETLGATGTIFTDKTGTLTENQMSVRCVVTPASRHELGDNAGEGSAEEDEAHQDDSLLRRVIEMAVLCNNASLGEDGQDDHADTAQGDPTEVALLRAGRDMGIRREHLLEDKPEVREHAFDPEVMMMGTVHEDDGRYELAVKGAPSAVLEACDTVVAEDGEHDEPLSDEARQAWLRRAEQLGDDGLRTLAVADRVLDDRDAEPYESLRLVGLVGLFDPPREGVRDLIGACKRAGIDVVMVTGDQANTARAIARQIGIVASEDAEAIPGRELVDPEDLSDQQRRRWLDTRVFSRVSPEQKLHLITVYQDSRQIVAMTGDGINDTPALEKADIGVAMGRRGTDAARQASDMVLENDAFSSIVKAIQEGRIIFGNIRKAVLFMLCTNVSEIIALAAASAAGAPLPLLPLQILYLNIWTDVWPALGLAVGKGNPDVMDDPPRDPDEPVLTRGHWSAVAGWGVVIAGCVLGALALGLRWLELDQKQAVTVSFLTLAFAKLWFVLNLRDRRSSFWHDTVVRNPWVWTAVGLCIVSILLAVYLPALSALLETRSPGARGWAVALVLSLIPVVAGQAIRTVRGKTS